MRKWFVISVLLAVLAMPGLSNAKEEQKDIATLEEVVVTATRHEQEIHKIPANVTVITAEEIEDSGATSIVEVLEKLEGINFRTFSGNSSQAYIDMRGFGGDTPFGKTLIMLDGRRLNRPDMASVNWLQIPINNVERIEVVRGASSVLYGDSAVAGVINIITKRGVGKPKVNTSVIAESYGLHDERVGITGATERFSYALIGENQKTFGYRERSKFSSKGAGLNLGYDLSDYFDISLGLSFNKIDFDMPGCLTKAQMEQNRRQYQPGHENDEASNEYKNANVRIKFFLSDFVQLDVNFLYGNKEIISLMSSFLSYDIFDIDTFGVTPKFILDKDVFGYENKLIAGLDYYHDTFDKDKFTDRERKFKTHIAKLKRKTVGFYIRDEFNIFEDLILSAGLRTERATIEGTEMELATQTKVFDDKKIHKAEAYEAGLTYLIGDKSKIFAKYAKVYRYPFLDEQASYFGFTVDTFLTELEKERGKSYELGTQFYPLENLKIGLTLFKINMEDEIAYNPITFRNENLDKTKHEGIEFAISYKPRKIASFYGNFTYHEAEFREGVNRGKNVPLVPKEMVNLGIELYLPYNFILRPEMRYVGESYLSGDFDNTTEKLDDYSLYDLFLVYKPEPDNLKFSAFLGVENLTDEMYSTFGRDNEQYGGLNTFYPSPGRTFKAGLSFMF